MASPPPGYSSVHLPPWQWVISQHPSSAGAIRRDQHLGWEHSWGRPLCGGTPHAPWCRPAVTGSQAEQTWKKRRAALKGWLQAGVQEGPGSLHPSPISLNRSLLWFPDTWGLFSSPSSQLPAGGRRKQGKAAREPGKIACLLSSWVLLSRLCFCPDQNNTAVQAELTADRGNPSLHCTVLTVWREVQPLAMQSEASPGSSVLPSPEQDRSYTAHHTQLSPAPHPTDPKGIRENGQKKTFLRTAAPSRALSARAERKKEKLLRICRYELM